MILPPSTLRGSHGNARRQKRAFALMEEVMASDFVVSCLPLSSQLAALRTLLASRGYPISPDRGERVCRLLNLRKPCPSNMAADRLTLALRACGFRIRRSLAFETLAAMCGGASWNQLQLPLSAPSSRYLLQIVQDVEQDSTFVEAESLSDLGKALRKHVDTFWPHDGSPSLCTLRVAQKAIALEFEHAQAPWLSCHLFKLIEGAEAPNLADLPEAEVRRFIRDTQRALEYAHAGMLVLGAIRTSALQPWYEFAPTIRDVASGDGRECANELDFFALLDAFELPQEPPAEESVYVLSSDAKHCLESRWISGIDGAERIAPISRSSLTSLRNRAARLRSMTGKSMTQFFAYHSTGKTILRNCHRIDTRALEDKRQAQGLSIAGLAARSDNALPALLRMRKYGWTDTQALPALASALAIEDPNELLPPVDEEHVGMHIERGEHLLKALAETHWWRKIIGESLQGEEAAAVERIAADIHEYVDLWQFANNPVIETTRSDEPITDERIAGYLQANLDELAAMGVAVIVERSIRYVSLPRRLPEMERSPLNHSTLYFEKIGQLRRPDTQAA